jgi:hypothetical protein
MQNGGAIHCIGIVNVCAARRNGCSGASLLRNGRRAEAVRGELHDNQHGTFAGGTLPRVQQSLFERGVITVRSLTGWLEGHLWRSL